MQKIPSSVHTHNSATPNTCRLRELVYKTVSLTQIPTVIAAPYYDSCASAA